MERSLLFEPAVVSSRAVLKSWTRASMLVRRRSSRSVWGRAACHSARGRGSLKEIVS